jgi:inhibitor of cysteine peptidase
MAALALCSVNVPAAENELKIKTETVETAPITASVGKEFRVVIEGNPTTGYTWQLAKPLDEKIVKLVSNRYDAPGRGGRVGQGGREVWTFKAVAAGKTTIEMKYIRVWEKDQPPARVACYSVEVK